MCGLPTKRGRPRARGLRAVILVLSEKVSLVRFPCWEFEGRIYFTMLEVFKLCFWGLCLGSVSCLFAYLSVDIYSAWAWDFYCASNEALKVSFYRE